MILPIGGVHRGTLRRCEYARLLSDDVTAVHVSVDAAETEKVRSKWEMWGDGTRLVIIDSPYRLMLEPLLDYIEHIAGSRQPNETHHHRRAAVRAEPLVAQPLAHSDGYLPAPPAAFQTGHRGHGRALSGRVITPGH